MSFPSARRWLYYLRSPWVIAPVVTFALYWRTLSLPFFWDDVPNFNLATTRTFLQIWTNVSGFPYYRPALFTFWKLALAVLPPAPTVLFHAINLLTHAANALLVGWLVRHFASASRTEVSTDLENHHPTTDLAGALATLIFVAYPFAVLPVSSVASWFHLAVTFMTLSTVVAAIKFIQTQSRGWLALAVGLALLTPFVHESGVMTGTLAAVAILLTDPAAVHRHKGFLALLLLASALFIPVWLAVPKSRGGYKWVGWLPFFASLTFFFQSPSFPVQMLARPLVDRFGLWDLGVIWGIGLGALLPVAWFMLRQRQWPPLVFGLAWIGLSMLPTVASLPFDYIATSPRLLYYTAPGAVVLWATAIATVAAVGSRVSRRPAIPLALGVLVAVPPMFYIERQITLHEVALHPLQALAAMTPQHPHERALLVNGVNWFNYRRTWYAIGHDGVSVTAGYIDFNDLIYINSGTRPNFSVATFSPVKSVLAQHFYSTLGEGLEWDWGKLAAEAPNFDRIWVTTYSNQGIRVGEGGAVKTGRPEKPASYVANFEDKIYLTSAEYQVERNEAVITLEWKYLGSGPDATIFRHLFDCSGNVMGLADGHAIEQILPFAYLSPGAEVRDVRHFTLEATSPDGCYALEVGLFLSDGSRVKVFAPDGSEFVNALVPIR